MPVYGLRPDDVVVDAAGNVQSGASLTLHATQADAEAGTGVLATVVTAAGRWTADVDVAPVWVRTPNGAVYQIEDFAAKADVSYVDAQIGGLSSTFARRDTGQRLMSHLDMGVGDLTLCVLGDSTGNDGFEWVKKFTDTLAARYPALTVDYALWSDASQSYPAPTRVQTGAQPATATLSDSFNRTAADLIASTPETGGAWQGTTGRFSLDGSKMVVNSAGLAHAYGSSTAAGTRTTATGITWSLTGAATVRTLEIGAKAVSADSHLFLSLSVPTGSGMTTSLWQRIGSIATKLADGPTITGTGSKTFTASIALDGLTVTAVVDGQTFTATISQATADTLAAGNGMTVWAKNADVAGTTIDAVKVETWAHSAGHSLTVYNGSMPGSTLAYQSARLPLMVPVSPDLFILSSSHNYNATDPATYLDTVDAFVADLLASHPDAGLVVSSQNPEFSDAGRSAAYVAAHVLRLAALRSHAPLKGWGYLPVFESFKSKPNDGRAWVMTDGIHPKYDPSGPNDGSDLWLSVVKAYFITGMSKRTDLAA